MALGYLIDPAFQSVNENGRPLVGGHIEVFYHNSHLPYVTKADFDGTNNPFKVPLNSKGMAVLIADDSNAYDVFCYDAFNALFWSRDNVVIGGSGAGITEIVFFDYETATYDDISIADGLGKLIVLKEVINMFNVAYAQMQYSVPLGSYVFTNIYKNNLTTYTIALDGTKTKQTIPIGGGSSGVEFISLSTTFSKVEQIITDGKFPILVEETTPGSPNYYTLINNNAGTEYIFGNISGTLNRTYKLSGGGWSLDASISFEDSSNKVSSWSSTPSDTNYPSEKLVYDTIGDLNKILSKNCFLTYVNKMSNNSSVLNYDSRLDIDLYKLNDLYEKVDGIKNTGPSFISLGIDSSNLDFFISFWINTHASYSSILTNTYVNDNTNNFGIYTGSSSGSLVGLVDTCWSGASQNTFQNGSGLEISNLSGKNFCKDVFYPFTNFKTGRNGTENISNIGIFSTSETFRVTIFSLTIIKSGVVVMDLVPCIRKADNVAGFYNKIDGLFIYNEQNPDGLEAVKLFN